MIEAFAAAVHGQAKWPRPLSESVIMAELCDRIREVASATGATP